ncbi:tripartite tricarboxylate transporter substrate binding protein [Ramlibacter sp. GTP1]|uniref:Tripartite tricarboxylate transporter substrate binding protein n=1 Tax=Ramlibacter albus TaxID=2079448 RepID=A0A923S877_9BURK|nr:tripartite tricarboxylate transporter substrate binding protein [Ramlibacter albus]
MKVKLILKSALIAAACAVAMTSAHAEWPEKIVRVVAPYGPGGGVDTFTRPIAQKLGTILGQTVIVDNKPGAGGTIGVKNVLDSPADGYTFLSGGVHQPMAESLYPKRGYDLEKDFVPVAMTARVPSVLVVTNSAPFASVKELIAYAKKNPGKVTYCSSGSGTAQHIVGESFKRLAGVSMLHIPYRSTAPAMTDLIGGQCMLMFDGLGTSAQQIRTGRIKLLAVATATRTPLFPDAPTLKEAGGPAMDATIWYGWWARRGTPAPVVEKMAHAIRETLKDPTVAEAWKTQGATVPAQGDAEAARYMQEEAGRWKKEVVDLKITTD